MERERLRLSPWASHPAVTHDARQGGNGPLNTGPDHTFINRTSNRHDHSPRATSRRTTAPSYTAPLRQDGGEGLSPPLNQQAPHGAPAVRRSCVDTRFAAVAARPDEVRCPARVARLSSSSRSTRTTGPGAAPGVGDWDVFHGLARYAGGTMDDIPRSFCPPDPGVPRPRTVRRSMR